MKRLITIILLFFSLVSIGQNELHIDKTFVRSKAYKDRFIPDGGKMLSDRLTKAYMLMAEKHGMAESIEFGWMSGGASKKRVSGINQFYTNLYDFYGTNDATQTTESSQPYVSGNIAPNEVEALKNPNGDDGYFTHPEISFASTDEWSVTTVLKLNGSNNSFEFYCGDMSSNSWISIKYNAFRFGFRNSVGGTVLLNDLNNYLSKNIIVTFIANGEGDLTVYVNSDFFDSDFIPTNIVFNVLLKGYNIHSFSGTISAHIIRSQALTPEQVAAEHALLRDIYPEIPSVKIGEQEWATSNLEMVATPEGNVIKNVTDATEWSNATVVYDSVYAATTGTATEKEYAALKASAYWCYYNNDPSIGATYGKLYNWYAAKLLDLDMESSGYGWRVPTQTDFTTLAATLGGFDVAGGKMKVPGLDYWNSPNTGADNSSGFSAIGSGWRSETYGSFTGFRSTTRMFTADNLSTDLGAMGWVESSASTNFSTTSQNKSRGLSIRLIKENN